MKKTKKIISLLLSVLMIITALPLTAVNSFAADEITSGKYKYVVLDDGTAEITDYFGSATKLTIPSEIDGYKVTSIGDSAFEHCDSFTSITIPDSVTSIGERVFSYCTSLTSITIPDSITSISNNAFSGCKSLASITIPDSITSIGNRAFSNCKSLTSITIPGSIISIGNSVFFCCTSLTSITVPNSVTSIGSSAFENCTSFTSITIPDGITSIDTRTFYGCTSLTSITIPNSVTSIGEYAFYDCTSLTSITIPDSVTIDSTAFDNTAYYNDESNWEDGLLYISNCLISGCVSGNAVIKQGVVTIADKAFAGDCQFLENITIPDSVTSIGNNAFYGCTALANVTLGDSVMSIGDGAFYGCALLKEIIVPESVNSIGDKALGYFKNGKKVNGFTIYGVRGTEAERYAKENGIRFTELTQPENLFVSKVPKKTTYFVGDTLDTTGLELTLIYSNGDTEVITNIFSDGEFDLSTVGTKTITVSYNGKTATFNVEVVKPSITLSSNSLSFDSINSTKALTATTAPSDQNITWISSNTSVATVSDDGVVTAKGDGNATITAKFTYNNIEYTATCNVTVRVPTVPTVTFPDVSNDAWYYNAIAFNANKGYFHGYGNGYFGPADNIQRQDFVVVLAKIANADLSAYEGQNGRFADVPTNDYYSAAIAWARANEILSGYADGRFGVGDPITREQACVIFYNYCHGSVSGDVNTVLAGYPDGGNVSDWARTAVAWAAQNNVVGGNGKLNPVGNANRAEMAQIIMNMSNNGIL